MLRLSLVIISTVFISTCFSQISGVGCNLFKTGVFSYRDSSSNNVWNIKRIKRKQTETNEQTGAVVKSKIKWVSDCEYKLTQFWTNKKELRYGNFKWRIFRITSITNNTYQYICNCSNGTQIGGTVVKLND